MLSRRDFLARSALSAAGLALTSVALQACASGFDGGSDDGPPRRGGTLTFATTAEPDSWDIHVSVSSLSALVLRSVYDSLTNLRQDGTVEPWLAKSWTVSPDGRQYAFDLREGVTFSDGAPFDAETVKLNFDHIVAPTTKSRFAKTLLGPYERTEVTGPHSVVVHLSAPYSPFLGAVSSTYLGFHSPQVLRDPGRIAQGGQNLVGTGPFVSTSLTAGQKASFARRAGYGWAPESVSNQGEAYLDGFDLQFLSDDAARVGALSSRQLDLADQVPPTQVATLKGQPDLEITGKDSLGAPFTYYLNSTRGPFADQKVRKAFQSAVDTAAITDGLFQGVYSSGWSAITSSTPGYDPSVEGTWGFSSDNADELLDQAGFTRTGEFRSRGGSPLTVTLVYASEFTTQSQLDYHTAVKEAVKAVGFDLQLRPLDTTGIVAAFTSGDYDLGAASATGVDGSVLRSLFHSAQLPAVGGGNVARVNDPELDQLLDRALNTADDEERNTLYGRVQHKVIEQAYILPTFVSQRTFASQKRVRGLALTVQNEPALGRIWLS
ncbi:ABC transporter substrate-binding protein [Rhodococcoides yunnanense]|uniref:ABC transporter substrate-binding protein n=1 Tax=Rhodococcoides yunnanense TaxID=278209 RepID=UPI0009352468|nr:ABC transporter substrate-binding protein [Rhodococcus yunnanensis]